jgi:hypothetical protein
MSVVKNKEVSMKRITAFLFASAFVLYMNVSAHAQGKGPGPGINRGPSANRGSSANRGPDHDRGHDAKDTKETRHDKDVHEVHHDAKVEDRIAQDPELKATVAALLPQGMDLKTASEGFKNQGQFIAALHVSKNLNIPFAELKAKMTGENSESLGKAIHELRPALPEKEANKEAEKAEKEAKADEKTKHPVS